MRRFIVFILIGAVLVFAALRVFKKPSVKAAAQKVTSQKSSKTAGKITPRSKEELAAERKKRKAEERARARELRRQKREQERARRLQSRYGYGYYGYRNPRVGRRGFRYGILGSARSRKTGSGFYVLKAILEVGNEKVALIDGREVRINEEIMGRKVTAIYDDRIIISVSGQTKEIKLGESLIPQTTERRR
ncbi:MAG: hypothetical protein NZ601_04585 [candidate division WOR-3 bacterium]|nr:hypothetical protein [candidate division WOR-3 bacterium]MCX7757636.1 hypothetical protein [candidate division WOR-3 bacterium]MDW7987456.1 hypothetical protein [candidate division WOR-3 bacterium]